MRRVNVEYNIIILKRCEIQTLPNGHAIDFVNLQAVGFHVDLLLLRHLRVQQIPLRGLRLRQRLRQQADGRAQRHQLLDERPMRLVLAQFDARPLRPIAEAHLAQRHVALLFGQLLLQLRNVARHVVDFERRLVVDALEHGFRVARLRDALGERLIGAAHLIGQIVHQLRQNDVDVRSQRLGAVQLLGGVLDGDTRVLDPLLVGGVTVV